MSSPRIRRLQSDYEGVSARFRRWPLVRIDFAEGLPPDLYRIWFGIKGLYLAPDGQLFERGEHVLEIKLGLEYPRRPPQLRLLTPLFHPNFNQTEVCAQDNYASSEGLEDLIIRIGRMIAYQDFNTKSPLNGIAAKWAAENSARLPVDSREIAPPSAAKAPAESAKSSMHCVKEAVLTPKRQEMGNRGGSERASPSIYVRPKYQPRQEMTLEQANAKLQKGELDGGDPAWVEGLSEWTSLSQIKGIVVPSPRP